MAYEISPILIDETPRIKHYCTYGKSINKTYCDGSYSAKAPEICPKGFVVEEGRRFAICDCGKTGNSPMCVGTHSKS